MENRVGHMAFYAGPHRQGVSDSLELVIDECVNSSRMRSQCAVWKITGRFIEKVIFTWQIQRIINQRSEEGIA
jgi:hypothetical protein